MTSNRIPSAFALRLVSGIDQGMAPADCIDVFDVVGDGVPLFRVTYDYTPEGGSEGDCVGRVSCLTDMTPEQLPFIINGFHLMGVVQDRLCDLLTGDHCFFADMFYDDETGEAIEHPIDFGVRNAIPSMSGM